MDTEDRRLIDALATSMRQARDTPRDAQAKTYIEQTVGREPDALYLLTQAVLLQREALEQAQARIADLEQQRSQPQQASQQGGLGGLLGSLFGGPQAQSAQRTQQQTRGGGFWAGRAQSASGRTRHSSSSFLRTAAGAAVGVAGGALLFEGLSGAFEGVSGAVDGLAQQGTELASGVGEAVSSADLGGIADVAGLSELGDLGSLFGEF